MTARALTRDRRPRRGLALLRLWHRRRVTRRHLRALPPERFADVGLTAQQARAEARRWFWQG